MELIAILVLADLSLSITPANALHADSKLLIRKSQQLPEYGTFHSIDDLVSSPGLGISLSRGIPAEQHALHLITCKATW